MKKGNSRINDALFVGARIFWVIITGLQLWVFVGGLAPFRDELASICEVEPCRFLNLAAQEAAGLKALGFSLPGYAMYTVILEATAAFAIMIPAILIFWRRRDDGFSLLVSFALVLFGLNFMAEADGAYFRANPAFANLYFSVSGGLVSVPFLSLFFLFPDGRFVPAWTRWLFLAYVGVAMIDPFIVAGGNRLLSEPTSVLSAGTLLVCLFAGIFAQVFRYRKVSSAAERQQTKWVIMGLVGLLVVIFTYLLFVEVLPRIGESPRLFFYLYIYSFDVLLYILFPVTMTISILRYRLWDIDLLIRRTLSYALLTGALGLVFFFGVVLLQGLFQSVTGEAGSPLATVLSTLAIAALFNPLRQRTQAFIDRRFYRAKYDAEQTLARFTDAARDEVDMGLLAGSLMGVVEETIRPEKVSLWIE